jgi:subtilase family serine protease
MKVNRMTLFYKTRYLTTVLAVLLSTLITITVGSTAVFAASGSTVAQRVTLPGQKAAVLNGYTPLHADQTNRKLALSISLNLRNTTALDQLLAAQNDPKSALYHHYLTPQEFSVAFSPTETSVQEVSTYLQSQGLTVTGVSANHTLISATGTEAQAEKSFQVNISDYQIGSRQVFSPTSNPTVPAALASLILNIGGLDNVAAYHHLNTIPPQVQPHAGPNGGFTPTDLRTAYNANSLVSASNGAGQTLAIFELDGYQSSDVNAYISHYGLGSAHYSNVLVDGASTSAGSGAVEDELDLEVAAAITPGATQKIYIGPNSTSGLNDTYNKIVTDDIAKVTSTSWGECESVSGNSELATLDNIFKQGAAQGQSFFAASGDSGAYDCGTRSLAVDSPADDPYVVGVGGTQLTLGAGSAYGSETAWGVSSKSEGSGGGISTYFTRPSYQTGTNLTNTHREVPDISADASPASGYSIYCTVAADADYGCTGWTSEGGTSAAAPLWASLATDVNGYLASQGKSSLGSASALIYKFYNTTQTYTAYHDVTSGNNLYYSATTGYDNATGIGTPNAWNFARDAANNR